MNQASLSMKVFGAYASLTGFGLLLVPDLFLAPLELWRLSVNRLLEE